MARSRARCMLAPAVHCVSYLLIVDACCCRLLLSAYKHRERRDGENDEEHGLSQGFKVRI